MWSLNRVFYFLALTVLVSGCVYDPNTRADFNFPTDRGDAAKGEQAFVDLGCHVCHSVYRTDLPVLPAPFPVHLELGGSTSDSKSEAELMTSLINPTHVISDRYRDQLRVTGEVPLDSPMPFFEDMTLGQLFDIVAFLDSKYSFVIDAGQD